MQMQLHEQTARLITYLKNAKPGSIISYGELSAQCDWDPRAKHLLLSAIQILYREGIQLRSIRGVGYERLDPNAGIKHIRRHHNVQTMRSTERLTRKVESISPAALNREGLHQFRQANSEIIARKYVEQQFMQDSVDEKIARRRLKQQEERRLKEEESRRKVFESAKKNKWG